MLGDGKSPIGLRLSVLSLVRKEHRLQPKAYKQGDYWVHIGVCDEMKSLPLPPAVSKLSPHLLKRRDGGC
jgi:hypothetical protein